MKKGEKRREQILDCAEIAFSKNGYYETQVYDIIQIARIAKGTIYQYFKNKEDVFISLLTKYASDWEKAISVDMDSFGGDKLNIDYARRFLEHRLNKTASFFAENKDRSNIILRLGPGVNSVIEVEMKSFEANILQIIANDIELGKKFGNIPSELNVEFIANAILGALLRLNYFFYVNEECCEIEREVFLKEINQLVLRCVQMD